MKIQYEKYKSLLVISIIIMVSGFIVFSCKKNDDVAPIITLIGADSIKSQPLNQVYVDQGATAMDETDGDISENVFVESDVNVDRLGWYTVTYNVVDEGGNSALPISRKVRVINQGYDHDGDFLAHEFKVHPEKDSCIYNTFFDLDSLVNLRMVFTNFACEDSLNVYAEMSGSLLEIPLQFIEDSTHRMSFQGSGFINDTLIYLEYLKTTDSSSSTWNSTFTRLSGF